MESKGGKGCGQRCKIDSVSCSLIKKRGYLGYLLPLNLET